VFPLVPAGRSRRAVQITVSIPSHSLPHRLSNSSWYTMYTDQQARGSTEVEPREIEQDRECVEACDFQ
jgi:hypothetical protein